VLIVVTLIKNSDPHHIPNLLFLKSPQRYGSLPSAFHAIERRSTYHLHSCQPRHRHRDSE